MNINRKTIKVILCILIYKIAMEYGYVKVILDRYQLFPKNIDLPRYVNGCIWIIILLLILEWKRKAVEFFLLFLIMFQIIPITVCYEFSYGDTMYYNMLCLLFLLCEMFVRGNRKRIYETGIKKIENYFVALMLFSALFSIVLCLRYYGFPSISVLNFRTVYDFRKTLTFTIGHYADKIFNLAVTLFLPMLISRSLLKKKYLTGLLLSGIQVAFYLYTGQKTYIMYIPLVIIAIWVKREGFHCEFWITSALGLSLFSVFCSKYQIDKIDDLYDLLIRRVLFLPAYLKFIHFDFFQNHDFIGLTGAIPRFLLLDPNNNYVLKPYVFQIGKLYFDAPKMSADTGFFIEGYSRFGYIGMVISFFILTMFFLLIDRFEQKNDYKTTIAYLIVPVYSLTESQIIGSLFFGKWFFVLLILLFYKRNKSEQKISFFRYLKRYRMKLRI